ncbi:hypothetical protein NDU88_003000 [Pleurodeles waltl]|uniref:Uncharacterized protein n=1 Tax=Pleurodeles waltl TaxID=8319 RepID=A0AAV7T4Z5_PLEWA|nr:hypothetical protein NDU88_003000 [Pleurodeles waltl]
MVAERAGWPQADMEVASGMRSLPLHTDCGSAPFSLTWIARTGAAAGINLSSLMVRDGLSWLRTVVGRSPEHDPGATLLGCVSLQGERRQRCQLSILGYFQEAGIFNSGRSWSGESTVLQTHEAKPGALKKSTQGGPPEHSALPSEAVQRDLGVMQDSTDCSLGTKKGPFEDHAGGGPEEEPGLVIIHHTPPSSEAQESAVQTPMSGLCSSPIALPISMQSIGSDVRNMSELLISLTEEIIGKFLISEQNQAIIRASCEVMETKINTLTENMMLLENAVGKLDKLVLSNKQDI